MLPEMLNVSVPEHLLAKRPSNYTDINHHVEQWKQVEEKRKKRRSGVRQHRHRHQEHMDTASTDSTDTQPIDTDPTETEQTGEAS